jgi:hypothetical protein
MQSLRIEPVKITRRDKKSKRNEVICPSPLPPPLFGPLDNLVYIAKVAKPPHPQLEAMLELLNKNFLVRKN